MSTDNKFGRCISFDGLIKNGRLYFKVMYDSGKYDAGFIDSIINKYTEELNNIAADSEPKEGIKVASDYGFSELSVDEFDDMLSAINDIMGD
jgi:phage terminase large subunit